MSAKKQAIDVNKILSSFTLNASGLNILLKGLRLLDWLNKNPICFLQETYHKYKDQEKNASGSEGKMYIM